MVIPLLVCIGLWILFPKGFKYLVGTGMGAVGGIVAWSVLTLAFPALFAWCFFLGFVWWGIVLGCILAAKG